MADGVAVSWMVFKDDDYQHIDSPVECISIVPRIGDTISVEGIGEMAGQWFGVEDVMWAYGSPELHPMVTYLEPVAADVRVCVVLGSVFQEVGGRS